MRFPPFAVDTHSCTLTRDGHQVDLFPQHVEVLAFLASRTGALVTKADLLEKFWADVAVTDNTVEKTIGRTRKALGDDPRNPRFIQTIKGKGYRFIAIVDTSGAPIQADLFDEWMKGKLWLETLNAEQLDAATKAFERVLARNHQYAAAYTALANAYFLQYEVTRPENTPNVALLDRAITHAQQAWKLNQDSAETAATLGFLFAAKGDFECARKWVRLATMMSEDVWRHHFRMAAVCWGDERLEAVKQTLKRKKDFAPAYFLRAMVFIARQVFDLAEEYAAQGAALQSAEALLRASASGGQVGSAATFPAFGLHWLHGLLLLRKGEIERALAAFEREIRETRRTSVFFREYRVNALIGSGYAHLAESDAAAAAHAFREALDVLPGNARALLGLRRALLQHGLDDEAEATAKRLQSSIIALTKAGRMADVALIGASVDAMRGNHQAAAVTLQRLVEQGPPSQIGWMIPIDPALAPLRDHAAFARVAALLSSRAS